MNPKKFGSSGGFKKKQKKLVREIFKRSSVKKCLSTRSEEIDNNEVNVNTSFHELSTTDRVSTIDCDIAISDADIVVQTNVPPDDENCRIDNNELSVNIFDELSATDPVPTVDCDIAISDTDYVVEINVPSDDTNSQRKIRDFPFNKIQFRSRLANWALANRINHEQLRGLLKIWNECVPLAALPNDPRTILETPRKVIIKNNNYWHRGLKGSLQKMLEKCSTVPGELSLKVNVDGISVSKSSAIEVWPILVEFAELPKSPPEVVGIYCGQGKPKDIESYLRQFVDETNDLILNGLIQNGRELKIISVMFIADSPARALLKSELYICSDKIKTHKNKATQLLSVDIMNFNGAHGCPKCETVGKYSYVSKTTVFTNINAKARTNDTFRSKSDPEHHKGETPLTDLPIDMVLDFPVGDELHLLHLGLMRKFLLGWKTGSLGMRTKWSSRNAQEISSYLLSCNNFKPSEIHRKIRGIGELLRWKGTELRTFLLYTSVTVLKKFLPNKHYKHYLLFYCSVVILGTEYHCKNMINLADEMIKSFLNLFKNIYGIEHFTSNLHNLSHLVEEVRRFGVLGKFNTYNFENKLQTIKGMVRSGNLPLIQIAKRILEKNNNKDSSLNLVSSSSVQLFGITKYRCDKFDEVGSSYTVYRGLSTDDFKIENTERDQWVFTRNHEIIRVEYFVLYQDKRCHYYGRSIVEKQFFFDIPFESDVLFIYAAKKALNSLKLYQVENIVCKFFCLPYCGSFDDSDMEEECPPFDHVFVPLWHTLK